MGLQRKGKIISRKFLTFKNFFIRKISLLSVLQKNAKFWRNKKGENFAKKSQKFCKQDRNYKKCKILHQIFEFFRIFANFSFIAITFRENHNKVDCEDDRWTQIHSLRTIKKWTVKTTLGLKYIQ